MGEFNWRGDKAMQQTTGVGNDVEGGGGDIMWKSRAGKRCEGIFARLPWGLQCQPPRPSLAAGTWRHTTTGKGYRLD